MKKYKRKKQSKIKVLIGSSARRKIIILLCFQIRLSLKEINCLPFMEKEQIGNFFYNTDLHTQTTNMIHLPSESGPILLSKA
jgi:hypothetical protein